LASLA